MSSLNEKLIKVQSTLKAPKGQMNKFGGYAYRSCEDILEAVKPILKDNGLSMTINDDILSVGEGANARVYVKATITVSDGEIEKVVNAFAREPLNKKGSDESQITGAASSYARKYALNGMFLIDDTKDADATNSHGKTESKKLPSKPAAKPKVQKPSEVKKVIDSAWE